MGRHGLARQRYTPTCMNKLSGRERTLRVLGEGATPLHRRLADELRRAIRDGALAAGEAVPSEAELSAAYGVSRGTVRQALAALRAESLIVGGRGAKPVVVRGLQLAQPFSELLSFSAWARSLGRTPSGHVISFGLQPADPATAEALGLEPGVPLRHLVRVRLADDVPLMIERTAFAPEVGELVAALDLEHDSIYAALGRRDVVFAAARQSVDAVTAGRLDARLLGVHARTPLLRIRRRTVSPAGRPLEWSDDRYRADLVSLTIENSARLPAVARRLAMGGG